MVQASKPAQSKDFKAVVDLLKQRNFSQAGIKLEQILKSNPRNADALYLKSVIAQENNRLTDAEILLKEVVKLSPRHIQAWLDLSSAQVLLRFFADAVISSEKALKLSPDNVLALFNLGSSYLRLNKHDEARTILSRLVKVCPQHELALYLLSMSYFKDEKSVEGAKYAMQALKINPRLSSLRIMLADYYGRHECKYSIAIQLLEEEIKLDPGSDSAYRFLGSYYAKLGEIDKAIELTRRQIAIKPDCPLAHGNLIVFLPYSPNSTNQMILEAANDFYKKCFIDKGHISNSDFSQITKDTNRTLRVGFVSGDLRKHALFFWLQGMFSQMRHKNIDVFCYCNNTEDDYSEKWKSEVEHWFNIKGLDDKLVFKRIQEDKIDILIDLSGHTEYNRLPLFALKPAPIQLTWLGQAGPIGLPELDYMFTDAYLIKPEEEKYYIEKIFRLPEVYAPYGTGITEELVPPPCLANKYITFGCFNNFVKVNKEVLNTWIEILRQVPDSKLFLKSHLFADENVLINIKQVFADKGIVPERLILESFDRDRDTYMKKYREIDIALDPFPIGGGTTTNDLVSVGVPLIAFYGKRCSHRSSAAILHHIGCDELIAHSREEYISKAVALANDIERIKNYRVQLSDKYLNSPFLDLDRFVDDFVNSLKSIWQEHCRGV